MKARDPDAPCTEIVGTIVDDIDPRIADRDRRTCSSPVV